MANYKGYLKDKDNNKILPQPERDIVMMRNSADVQVTSASNYQTRTIPFNEAVSLSTNSKLTFNSSNNSVDIGAGVNKVKISLTCYLYISDFQFGVNIWVGSNRTGHWENYDHSYLTRTISDFIISVKEGDSVKGTIYFGPANKTATVFASSFLTVEVIE